MVWDLKPGDSIAVCGYGGSWNPPGTRYWYEKIFICIAGNKVYYIAKDGVSISYVMSMLSLKPIDDLAAIDAEIDTYRAANPDWESYGM